MAIVYLSSVYIGAFLSKMSAPTVAPFPSLALAILDDVTRIETILFVSHRPKWPREVRPPSP